MKAKAVDIKKRIKAFLSKWLKFLLNPRLLLCLLIAWMITNGWSYVFAAVGALCDIPWMAITGTAYMGMLWLPFTPEKIITLFIAIFLLRLLFPKDEKTLGVLHEELSKVKNALTKKRKKVKHKINTDIEKADAKIKRPLPKSSDTVI